MKNGKVQIGIIGCGGIANGKHFPGMAAMEGVEMCAFCDLIIERAEKAAKEYVDGKDSAMNTRVAALEAVKDGAHFLIDIMPVMFISPAVGIMEVAGIIKNSWIPYISIIVITCII